MPDWPFLLNPDTVTTAQLAEADRLSVAIVLAIGDIADDAGNTSAPNETLAALAAQLALEAAGVPTYLYEAGSDVLEEAWSALEDQLGIVDAPRMDWLDPSPSDG